MTPRSRWSSWTRNGTRLAKQPCMPIIQRTLTSLLLTGLAFTAGCTDEADIGDDADAAIDVDGKADGTSWNGGEIAGALRTAATLDEDELVEDVGLTRRAARGIVAARPIRNLAALDAVAYVGPISLGRLVAFADAAGWTVADMVEIPRGEFQMGAPADTSTLFDPLHPVYLSRFWIDRTEVTNRDWNACADDGACPRKPHDPNLPSGYETDSTFDEFPAVNVTRKEAQAYCEWLGKSLPTEAQWEKAARGTADTRSFPWGDAPPTCELTNVGLGCTPNQFGLALNAAAAVGTFALDKSPYGVLDLGGNVTEHVYDVWDHDPMSSCTARCEDPEGPSVATEAPHAVRGASYTTAAFTPHLRLHHRQGRILDFFGRDTGFRCAVR
jgi:formylglycine-generating enzyme